MNGFTEYEVIKPPTSGEVREELFKSLQEQRPLTLTLLGRFAVPNPEPTEMSFRVGRTLHPEEDPTLYMDGEAELSVLTHVHGATEDGTSVYLDVYEDEARAATVTLLPSAL